jgi:DMSO/TMAO reductase YedYZ molybdopterin-dependent catalytic subunit
MKKISLLALAAFAAAFTAYRAFDELAKSMEDWDIDWDEDLDNLDV